jgi:hexosaminidase
MERYDLSVLVLTYLIYLVYIGLMIDTARHYLPVKKILSILKAMSYIKLNVLHWHVIDAQSFPYVVPSVPELSQKGSYAPKLIYTPEDVSLIVKTGRSYGIRVIPEFDVPGHAASWGKAFPEVTAKCPSFYDDMNQIPLDPTKEKTYQLLEAIISSAGKSYIDEYIHLGGDELVMDVSNYYHD